MSSGKRFLTQLFVDANEWESVSSEKDGWLSIKELYDSKLGEGTSEGTVQS